MASQVRVMFAFRSNLRLRHFMFSLVRQSGSVLRGPSSCCGQPLQTSARRDLRQSKFAPRLRTLYQTRALHSILMNESTTIDPQLAVFLDRVREVNSSATELQTLYTLFCNDSKIGGVTENLVIHLESYTNVFSVDHNARSISIHSGLSTSEERTKSVGDVMEELCKKNIVVGWRNELYPVASAFGGDPLFLVERAAALTLGIKAYGVHVNGYVMKEGKMFMWVAKRSPTKPTWPGKLDHIAAGGQPVGVGLMENVIKECEEEAGIPKELAQLAKPVGAVSYAYIQDVGFKQDVLFVYDLLLPEDFVPTPNDGEVDEFSLRPINEVVEIVQMTKEYKPNCALVVIDFFIRHGIVSPDQTGYLELLRSVRNGELV